MFILQTDRGDGYIVSVLVLFRDLKPVFFKVCFGYLG